MVDLFDNIKNFDFFLFNERICPLCAVQNFYEKILAVPCRILFLPVIDNPVNNSIYLRILSNSLKYPLELRYFFYCCVRSIRHEYFSKIMALSFKSCARFLTTTCTHDFYYKFQY